MDSKTAYKSRVQRWIMLSVIIVPFMFLIYGIYTLWMKWVTPLDVGLLLFGWIGTGLGITVGFHRMVTHQSFKTTWWMESFILALGSMAMEGGVLSWVAIHREHHANSDKEGDPHSPLDGLAHSHLGWMIDGFLANREKYTKKELERRLYVLFERYALVWFGVGLAIPTLIGYAATGTGKGAWMAFVWGGMVRVLFTHHVTWSVNSICHTYGSRMFETRDMSRNNLLVGILALGEGWHNNHHAAPRSANHGMTWWQVDLSAAVIWILMKFGLAWEVQWTHANQVKTPRAA